MFSYRHGFHAGNHADVLKHMALIAVLKHLTSKPTAITVIDTHAGAGLYRLDSDFAGTSGEAGDGIVKLMASALAAADDVPPVLSDYMQLVASFNGATKLKVYPGSPFVTHTLLRQEARDKLWLFELHPTDSKALVAHVAQMQAGRSVDVERADGFESLHRLLPPPSRRGLVLIDPSYEIKSDYARVVSAVQEGLKRFATGTFFVWYPVIPRPEAHELPRRLKTISQQAGRSWLHATLAIGHEPTRDVVVPGTGVQRHGLTASGVFIVNPPHTLKPALQAALPRVLEVLGRGRGQAQKVEGANV